MQGKHGERPNGLRGWWRKLFGCSSERELEWDQRQLDDFKRFFDEWRLYEQSGERGMTKWLNRGLVLGPHLAVCLNEKEFIAACKHCKVTIDKTGPWLDCKKNVAQVHTFESQEKLTCVVCVNLDAYKDDPDDSELWAVMAHEATHVFQRFCDHIGETKPSREFHAYSIQSITLELIREVMRRKKGGEA